MRHLGRTARFLAFRSHWRIIVQTRVRILGGDKHYRDKVFSLFEPHTEAIRKGKASKPTEFGKLVEIQEARRISSWSTTRSTSDGPTIEPWRFRAWRRTNGSSVALRNCWPPIEAFGPMPTSAPPTAPASKECVSLRLESPRPNNARSNINGGFAAASGCGRDARDGSAS